MLNSPDATEISGGNGSSRRPCCRSAGFQPAWAVRKSQADKLSYFQCNLSAFAFSPAQSSPVQPSPAKSKRFLSMNRKRTHFPHPPSFPLSSRRSAAQTDSSRRSMAQTDSTFCFLLSPPAQRTFLTRFDAARIIPFCANLREFACFCARCFQAFSHVLTRINVTLRRAELRPSSQPSTQITLNSSHGGCCRAGYFVVQRN